MEEVKLQEKTDTPGPEPKDPKGRGHTKAESCPKCGKVYHKFAGIRARERHEVDCKGEEGPLFVDNPKQREKAVTRPPKKQLWYCTCGASFYREATRCPGCGEEIEW